MLSLDKTQSEEPYVHCDSEVCRSRSSWSSYELAALQQSPGDLSHTTLVECVGIVPFSTVKIAAWMEARSLPMSVCLTISTPVAP